jgi:hypothetical protein
MQPAKPVAKAQPIEEPADEMEPALQPALVGA